MDAKNSGVMASLRADAEVMAELSEMVHAKKKFARAETLPGGNKELATALESMSNEGAGFASHDAMAEAIILVQGRPSLLVRGGKIDEPNLPVWRERLAPTKAKLEAKVIPAVGRIEFVGHPDFDWGGTGWLLEGNIVVTNRHVASLVAQKQGGRLAFRRGANGFPMQVRIDFREEYGSDEAEELFVDRIEYLADPGQPDIALLRIGTPSTLPAPLVLAGRDAASGTHIGVIGYPAIDSQRNPIANIRDIFKDIYDVKRFAPGLVSSTSDANVLMHDASTMGGNSGSPVVSLETGEVVGLHFSGKFGESNYAVKASLLKRAMLGLGGRTVAGGGVPTAAEEGRTKAELESREGYVESFLGSSAALKVELPTMTPEMLADAVPVHPTGRGISKYVLDYTHFSIVMCKSRRMAFFTVVNIDGTQEVSVRGRPRWILDPRIPAEFQIDDTHYDGNRNKVDRGHLVRRLDPVWGSNAVAKQANDDTHIFTNAAPQQHNYNDGPWGDLEDYLLFSTNNADQKLTMFTGPVLRDSDITYRGAQIPAEFWKVAVMKLPSGQLHATGYVVSQVPYLDDLEFVPGAFRTFQRKISFIEGLTGLNFGTLKDRDPLGGSESIGEGGVIGSAADVVF